MRLSFRLFLEGLHKELVVREAVDAYLADRSVDPARALDSTFGALPRLEVPSRNEWERA